MMFEVNSGRPNSDMKINSFDLITVCIVFLAVTFFVYYMYFNKHIKTVLSMYLILDGFLKTNK